jgi:hypothetical protein
MHLHMIYALQDTGLVRQLVDILRTGGHRPRTNIRLRRDILWQDQVREAIREADVCIYALTPESIAASSPSRWEFTTALQLRKPTLPVLLQDTDLPEEIEAQGYLDLRQGLTPAAVAALLGELSEIAILVAQDTAAFRPIKGPDSWTPANEGQPPVRSRRGLLLFGFVALILFGTVAAIAFFTANRGRDESTPALAAIQMTGTQVAVVDVMTETPVPSRTPTPTVTDTATSSPTVTDSPTTTSTLTQTPLPTATPSQTPTSTATFTPSPSATNTPSFTPTLTASSTPTITPSATPTHTATVIPTATPTATSSATATLTATSTPTATPTVTESPTEMPTATNTPSVTPTSTATQTPSRTRTRPITATRTPTTTLTPSLSPTPTSLFLGTVDEDCILLTRITNPDGADVYEAPEETLIIHLEPGVILHFSFCDPQEGWFQVFTAEGELGWLHFDNAYLVILPETAEPGGGTG